MTLRMGTPIAIELAGLALSQTPSTSEMYFKGLGVLSLLCVLYLFFTIVGFCIDPDDTKSLERDFKPIEHPFYGLVACTTAISAISILSLVFGYIVVHPNQFLDIITL